MRVFENVNLIDGISSTVQKGQSVVVDSESIRWVGPARDLPRLGVDLHTIDGQGKTLLPGLIDSHIHLCADPTRPPRYDSMSISEAELAVRVLTHAQEALLGGVTTVVDCGGRGYITLDVRDAIDAGITAGPKILTTGQGISITGGHFHWYSIEADDRFELRKAVRTLAKRGVDHIKVFGTGGGSTMSSNPARAQYSVDEFREIIGEAERAGITVTAHLHGTPGIRNAIEADIHRLEHVQFFTESGDIDYDEQVVDEIVRKRIPISLGMAKRWRTDQEIAAHLTSRQAEQIALRDKRINVLRNFHEAGVDLIASTDAGMAMTPFSDLPALLTFLMDILDLTVAEAVAMATSRAAKALRIGNVTGSVQKGMLADLVLVHSDLTNVRDLTAHFDKNVTVYRSGREVADRGTLTLQSA